jgi:hypothetical protein
MQRPPELISYPQQIAITATGLIWSRFSTQIVPVSGPAVGSHESVACSLNSEHPPHPPPCPSFHPCILTGRKTTTYWQ